MEVLVISGQVLPLFWNKKLRVHFCNSIETLEQNYHKQMPWAVITNAENNFMKWILIALSN